MKDHVYVPPRREKCCFALAENEERDFPALPSPGIQVRDNLWFLQFCGVVGPRFSWGFSWGTLWASQGGPSGATGGEVTPSAPSAPTPSAPTPSTPSGGDALFYIVPAKSSDSSSSLFARFVNSFIEQLLALAGTWLAKLTIAIGSFFINIRFEESTPNDEGGEPPVETAVEQIGARYIKKGPAVEQIGPFLTNAHSTVNNPPYYSKGPGAE